MATSDGPRRQPARNLQAGSPRFESGTAHSANGLLMRGFRCAGQFEALDWRRGASRRDPLKLTRSAPFT
jgi:hypothetical protein